MTDVKPQWRIDYEAALKEIPDWLEANGLTDEVAYKAEWDRLKALPQPWQLGGFASEQEHEAEWGKVLAECKRRELTDRDISATFYMCGILPGVADLGETVRAPEEYAASRREFWAGKTWCEVDGRIREGGRAHG